jgi:LysR family pca operon transcriptional activator
MYTPHIGKLRLKSLQILLLAKELKSLRAVADAVSTSQPAVTQTLQELERTFGKPLLLRDHRGVTLTPAGELVAARAKVVLEEMKATTESLRSAQPVPILRLGVLPFLMYDLVPRALRHLKEREIPMRLKIHETYVTDLRERLFAGEEDLVITRLASTAVDVAQFKSIRLQRLATETVTPFIGQSHPLYKLAISGQGVDPELLRGCEWVLPPESTEVRRVVDELLMHCGLPPAIPSVEVASLHSMMMIVGATATVGAGPLSTVNQMIKILNLVPLKLLKFKPPKTITVAMFHARQDTNPLIPIFLQSVQSSYLNK